MILFEDSVDSESEVEEGFFRGLVKKTFKGSSR